MKTAEEILAFVDLLVFLPLILLINFSLFQYLVTTFWKRREERRVRMLFLVAALSFVTVIPFGFPDLEVERNLNDISEVCSVLTFLMQITILTRDVDKRIKIRSLWVLLWIGEMMVMLSILMLFSNFIDIFAPEIQMAIAEDLDDIVEISSLLYIVGFRFYFLSIAKGFKKVWATQKTELFVYVLFLTHSFPFLVLNHMTGWSWKIAQGLWMRATIVMCLWRTVHARITSQTSKGGLSSIHGNGPRNSEFGGSQAVHKQLNKVVTGKPVSKTKFSTITAASTFRSMTSVMPQEVSPVGRSKTPDDVERFN